MPHTINPIIEACQAGHQTLLVSGRSLSDLHVNELGKIRPLKNTLLRRAHEEFGMATIIFNLAQGARWEWQGIDGEARRAFEKRLEQGCERLVAGVQAASNRGTPSFERAFLLLTAIQRSLESSHALPPVLVLWEFGDDIVPEMERGAPSGWMTQIAELTQLIASDYRRRLHPFLFILNGIPDHIDRRVVRALQEIHLCQPNKDDKVAFIRALRTASKTKGASLENGLDDATIANLTASTPNQSLEEAFLGSARTGRAITTAQLSDNKRDDVVRLSEGTLTMLDTERVGKVRLVGKTIERVMQLLEFWAQGLREGNPLTPTNVILAGAPSTAKTDLALMTALRSGTPAYSINSPKGSLVGETERRVRVLFRVFKELSPAFGMIDEITEAFPMERNSANLDSGATSSVVAEMMNALADNSRSGRTLLLATTNCPWKVGAAMASRFLYVPVLMAVEDDMPGILCAIASNLLPNLDWDPDDAASGDAAREFHRKGASPRVIRTLLSSKIATSGGKVGSDLLKRAAAACAPQDPRDRASAEYADLFAIRACSDLEMLPWYGRISSYPLPAYLKGVVDERSGDIDVDFLDSRIRELKPNVNV